MLKKIFKRKKGIFPKLMASYIVFSILVTISFVICLLISAVTISEGDTMGLSPYGVVDEKGNIVNLEAVTNLDGWIEELDKDYKVVQVYGEKRTENMQYTQEEIYHLISMKMNDGREYIGFMNTVRDSERYFLCVYGTDVMKVETVVTLDVTSEGSGGWAKFFAVIFFIFFFINCFLMSLYLRKKIQKPLQKLILGMEEVKHGKIGKPLDFKTEAEFEEIRDTFNMMTEQLAKEKKEKEEAVKKRNQLILELSHDIKTPTATIKSYANALEAGLVPEEKRQDYYHTIDLKADRITNLSEDMFMLLKMENPDYQLTPEKTDLSELLRKICVEHYEEIIDAGFEFEINIPEDMSMMAMVDVRLFTRVISNLLVNAKKYNKTGHMIELKVRHINETWQIDVLDDGEEINQTLSGALFEAFVRGDKARRSDGGTGLGLAISKAIIEKHHGRIEYERVSDRNCFRVSLSDIHAQEGSTSVS